jgi:integrase
MSMHQYKTAWFLRDMNNISQQIYEAISKASAESSYSKNKELWLQYAAYIFLSGRRRMEPMLLNPTVSLIETRPRIYNITTVNEKHFIVKHRKKKAAETAKHPQEGIDPAYAKILALLEKRSKKKQPVVPGTERQIIQAPFMVMDKYENALFQFIMKGRKLATLDFTPLLVGRTAKNISLGMSTAELRQVGSYVSRDFTGRLKMNITDGVKHLDNASVPLHLLRHIRAYDLLINKDYPPTIIQRLLGWNDIKMVYYYADIVNAFNAKEQISMYKRMAASPMHGY